MAVIEAEEKLDIRDIDKNSLVAEKLTDWENEPSAMRLKEDLEAARDAHTTHVTNVKRWKDIIEVTGSQKPKKVQGRSSIQPKLARKQNEWRYSALSEPFLSSDKLFSIKPVTFEDTKAAIQNDLVLNWQFRTKINRVKFIDEYIRTGVDEGTVIVRVGWARATVKAKKTVPIWQYMSAIPESPEGVMLQEALAQKKANPREFLDKAPEELQESVKYLEETGQINVATKVGEEEIEYDKIVENKPELRIVNAENFFWDPSCGGDLEKATFVVESFETSKAELIKDGRYKNLETVNWELANPLSEPDHATSTPQAFNFKDQLRKRIVAYEYWGLWDINKDGVLIPIVATWIGDTLIRMEENPFPDQKHPYVDVAYMPRKREVTGEPDAELLEDNQKVLGATMRGMIDLMGRSANGQVGFAKGMLDVLNRKRFENGQDYEFNPNMPPSQGVIEGKFPEIPNSAMNMIQLMHNEAESLTGVKAFSGGVSGEAYGDVAAGIKGALDAASKREMSILRRFADGIQRIGRKIIAMNGVFFSKEETIRITNDEFVKVTREDLQGAFDLLVDIATAEVDSNKASKLGFMLQTLGNSVTQDITIGILAEIAHLERMPDLAKKLRDYKPQPDPLAEKLKELEVKKVELEIQKIESEIALNNAKRIETLTKADLNDLEKTETETGTTHERDLEKMRAQAEGNKDLEVTKAMVKPRKFEESRPDIEGAIGYNMTSKRLARESGRPDPVQPAPLNVPPMQVQPQQLPQLQVPPLAPAMPANI